MTAASRDRKYVADAIARDRSYGCIAKEIVVRKTMNTRKPVVPYESKRQAEEKAAQQQLLQQQQLAAKNKVSVEDDLVGGDWEEVQVRACVFMCVHVVF